MWDWHWWCCFLPTTIQKQPNQSSLLTPHHRNDAVCSSDCISFAAIARMLTSWLNRRRRRYLLLFFCSPFLIPLFFVTCPFICAVEFFLYISRRRPTPVDGGARSDGGDEVGLLQRYLEDQLTLVLGSVYECGDDDENVEEDYGVDVEYIDSMRPLLQ